MKTLLCALAAFAVSALPATADTLAEFAADTTGSWTSVEQSASPDYAWIESDTRQIWTDRDDGVWFYQENASMGDNPDSEPTADAKSKPYFQIVIQARDLGDGDVHTTSWRLDRAAGADIHAEMQKPDVAFKPEWLTEVACMGRMQRVGAGYWEGGSTCPNTYKGGVKVESRTIRAPGLYVNWDRGFNAEGEHIWGPASGGYIFKRK